MSGERIEVRYFTEHYLDKLVGELGQLRRHFPPSRDQASVEEEAVRRGLVLARELRLQAKRLAASGAIS